MVIASFLAVDAHIDMMCIGVILRRRDKSENRVCMIQYYGIQHELVFFSDH